MNAQEQWGNLVNIESRVILRNIGASRKVADALKDRQWAQLSRWAKKGLKRLVEKLKRDNLWKLEDYASEIRKENRERQRPKE